MFAKRFLPALLFLWIAGLPLHSQAQLTVTASNNAAALVTTLVGPGVQVSNITMNCPTGAAGTFNGSATNLGIGAGVLLTTGSVAVAAQPNVGGAAGSDNGGLGDNELTLLGGDPTFDACALEFDFVAVCDTISIAYVLASEEYDEFVCAGVNDVFAFFITGPGLANVNIATVPGSAVPVSINTVNLGTGVGGPGCVTTNSAYYTQNLTNTTHEYDGQTVRLEAKTWVQPCSTYHVKLVVADGGDGVYDSGVFLEQAGIRCASQQISVNTATASGSNYLVEGCTDATLILERSGNISLPLTIHYNIGGNAQNGVDYGQIADSVVFAAGIDSVGILINGIADGLAEGLESILIIVADSNCGGVYADTAEIFIIDAPRAEFASVPACPFFPVQFTNQSSFAGVIAQFAWDFGDGGTSSLGSPQHSYAAAGQYTVSLLIVGTEGCRDSITHTVTVLPAPTAQWSASQFCQQFPTIFDDGSPTPGLVQWNWDFGDGNTGQGDLVAYQYANAGNYGVTLVVTAPNGCRDTSIQAITIYPSPAAEFGWTDICNGSPMAFTDLSTMNPGSITTWIWSLGDGSSFNTSSVNHVYPGSGTFAVDLIVESDQGCKDTVSHSVNVFPNPVPDFSYNFACIGDTTFFLDQSTISSGANAAWDWQFGDGGSSQSTNPFHVYLASNNYLVSLSVTSDQGCVTLLERNIGRPPMPPAPNVINDTMCFGFAGVLQAFTNEPGGVIRWYDTPLGSDVLVTGNSIPTPPLTYTTPWYVDVLSVEGCVSDRMPVYGVVSPGPTVLVDVSATAVEIPNAIVEFMASDLIGNVVVWNWNFGDGNGSSSVSPVHQYAAAGSYLASLTVTSNFGCEAVYPLPPIMVGQEIRLYTPNAFTPNGDGLNDVFEVYSRLVTQLSIRIYDRWGKLLFASENLNFTWAGKDASGVEVPEGTYVYVINAIGFDGQPIERAGSVILIR